MEPHFFNLFLFMKIHNVIISSILAIVPMAKAQLVELNIAQGKPTFGDTSFGAPTGRGNDGIDGVENTANWTHADYPTSAIPYPGEVDVAPNPYWQVDLGESFDLTRLQLVDRVGCCDPNRLNGSTITLFDGLGEVIGAPIEVDGFPASSQVADAVLDFDNEGAGWVGVASIRIDGLETNQYFQFSEFRAFSMQPEPPKNHALGAAVGFFNAEGVAVGAWGSLPEANVTDGAKGTLSHPLDQISPDYYLEVDLGEAVIAGNIAITGRLDDCCPERLEDAKLELLDAGKNVVFTHVMAGQVTDTQVFEVPGGIAAQFVRITNANGADYGPQVGEVEVFGLAGDPQILVDVESADPVTGFVSLSFKASGGTFAVFASSSMEEGTWAGIVDNITPDEDVTTVEFTDSFAIGVARRFYRVERE